MTVLGAEGLAPYDRPPLSKELFTRTSPAWLRESLGTDLAAADDVRLAESATGLTPRPDGVRVRTSAGAIDADAVVLATGARPVLPGRWHARTLRTASDAAALRDAVGPGTRFVVLGAGWIGAEVAGVAAAAGARVTVVEAGAAPLASALGATVGARTAQWYRDSGIELLVDSPAAAVDEGSHRVRLTDGSVLEADVVLAAVGARPDTDWLAMSLPVRPDGYLTVDARWQVPGTHGRVAAVGDVARRPSARHGWVGGGHWDAALRGPDLAVRTLLLGADAGPLPPTGDPAPYVFSTQLGHDLGLLGLPGRQDDLVVREAGRGWTALWFSRDSTGEPAGAVLTAVLAVDTPRDVAAARKLFAGTALPRLDRDRAADPGIPLRELLLG